MNDATWKRVAQLEGEIRKKVREQNERDLLFADLTGLFVEIIEEISRKNKEKPQMIYYYANLLEQEIQFYSAADAYMTGASARGRSNVDALYEYQRKVLAKIAEQGLDCEIRTCFNELAMLLGDSHGLISEFTEIYRTVHGAIKNNVAMFVEMGQAADVEGSDKGTPR